LLMPVVELRIECIVAHEGQGCGLVSSLDVRTHARKPVTLAPGRRRKEQVVVVDFANGERRDYIKVRRWFVLHGRHLALNDGGGKDSQEDECPCHNSLLSPDPHGLSCSVAGERFSTRPCPRYSFSSIAAALRPRPRGYSPLPPPHCVGTDRSRRPRVLCPVWCEPGSPPRPSAVRS